jgi:hypothetical protein
MFDPVSAYSVSYLRAVPGPHEEIGFLMCQHDLSMDI